MSTTTLELTLDNGKTIPLRQQRSQTSGNIYWAVLATKGNGERYYNRRGVMVDANVIGDTLPSTITFAGQEVPLTAGESDKGKAKVSATVSVQVPSHGRKQLSFRVTEVSRDDNGVIFNIDAIVNGGNGGPKAVSAL